jgi:HD-GYP domain-containing protein (c-di-GMP phosphodiesterase class II)
MLLLINELKDGMKLKNTIYLGNSILVEKDTILTEAIIDKLKQFKILSAEIEENYQNFEENIEEIIVQEKILKDAISRDFDNAIEKSSEIMNNIVSGDLNVKEVESVVETTINNVLMDSNISLGLLEGRGGHNYLFKHAVNTVIISAIIGKALNYTEEQMNILCKGALLHDVGMLKLDEKLLAKKEELTDIELKEIEKHTIYGYEALKPLGEEVAKIAKYHHEKIDGTGYPDGLKGEDIPEMARIVAIADIYTALTEDRKYRTKYDNHAAMKIVMQSTATNVLDHRLLKIFLAFMPIYPINSKVILNDNKIATVVRANKNPFRPVVDIDENGKITRIDLMSEINATKYIIGVKK